MSELRISVGYGYRIYFTIRNNEFIILLCGCDKATQQRDIEKAKGIARLETDTGLNRESLYKGLSEKIQPKPNGFIKALHIYQITCCVMINHTRVIVYCGLL